jgi:hypothetical protein
MDEVLQRRYLAGPVAPEHARKGMISMTTMVRPLANPSAPWQTWITQGDHITGANPVEDILHRFYEEVASFLAEVPRRHDYAVELTFEDYVTFGSFLRRTSPSLSGRQLSDVFVAFAARVEEQVNMVHGSLEAWDRSCFNQTVQDLANRLADQVI